MDSWMTLVEYSRTYSVSVSTLRRRIKNNQIQFRYKDGKYFIKGHADVVNSPPITPASPSPMPEVSPTGDDFVVIHKDTLQNLKESYTRLIKEKNLRIVDLKKHIEDLKGSVNQLESRNTTIVEDAEDHLDQISQYLEEPFEHMPREYQSQTEMSQPIQEADGVIEGGVVPEMTADALNLSFEESSFVIDNEEEMELEKDLQKELTVPALS